MTKATESESPWRGLVPVATETQSLGSLEPAGQNAINGRALQERVDTKFVAPRHLLPLLLHRMRRHFRLVLSAGKVFARYETLYFDSPDFRFYEDQRRGRPSRHKVRIRQYMERNLCFLETKTKDCRDLTTKRRFPRQSGRFDLGGTDDETIAGSIGATGALRPVLRVYFCRATAVGIRSPDRVTIDFGIRMSAEGRACGFEGAAIVELKQARFNVRSPGFTALRASGIRAERVSKYCVGLVALGQVLRPDLFRPGVRALSRAEAQWVS